MKVCFIADGRSPIALNWISHFIQSDYDVEVISTYTCAVDELAGATVHQVPFLFSRLAGSSHTRNGEAAGPRPLLKSFLSNLRSGALSGISSSAQMWFSSVEVQRHVERVSNLISQISPDIVHAMRIPFEGILASRATPTSIPLLISVWGNDFTLFANSNPLIARQTRQALERADALHCDCRRDLRMATESEGFSAEKPHLVAPGAGGIQSSLFYPGEPDRALRERLRISEAAPVIINPRGFRGYVRNDVFFQAIPQVLLKWPQAVFVCVGMQSNPVAEKWAAQLGVKNNVRLLPAVSRKEMADLFRLSDVAVSPSLHDGTPNTLLEAMACGSFPVAGAIESVREWIDDGSNGLLCDPTSPASLAVAIARALGDGQMRERARQLNLRLIAERAEYTQVMKRAEGFYLQVAARNEQAAGA